MKGESGQYFFVSSNRFNVEKALVLKSTIGIIVAKSWDGCAAKCKISFIDFLYFLKIFSMEK